ncbi:hypothetical protein Cyan7822_6648 [Sporocytophaga myxococcoides]|uniref:Uncharacterized protein n=1 Tax=Sporocytophaga myxococcoides TaxID=153721 RepID=A0A098LFG5_9BACT|nr:hypothetical protein [Sporocytophaga myxococcoides]GAL84753.1 hypothetical protein Cyan7822_6648 [Sporocytophaga myxococcoides]
MKKVKIFNYLPEIDSFVIDPLYKEISGRLGLREWNEVVWIGRYFCMDNDFGEHWFDNWEERDKVESKARTLGIEYDDLFVIDPSRFKDSRDGPCHTDLERKNFWTDVLMSLELNMETIFSEARKYNSERDLKDDGYIENLELIIEEIRSNGV